MTIKTTLRRIARRTPLVEVHDRVLRRSLDDLGCAARLPQASTGTGTLAGIEAAIGSRRVTNLAVIAASRPTATGAVFARRYPRARVHVLDVGAGSAAVRRSPRRVTVHRTPTLDAAHRRLSSLPPVQVLVDLARVGRTARLRHLLFHVRAEGLYLIDDLALGPGAGARGAGDNDTWRVLSRLLEIKVARASPTLREWHDYDVARAEAIGTVGHDGRVVSIRKIGRHGLKLHDAEAEDVLRGRHGDGWGRRLATREPLVFQARGTAHANRLEETFRDRMEVPRLYLREYRNVVCAPRQLVVQGGDLILPISFHHAMRPRLQSRSTLLRPTGSHYAVLDESLSRATHLPGVYFHLDSEFPGHFGHFMTEDIAKLWAWPAARAAYPHVKVLLSTGTPGGGPSTVQRVLLDAWGIPASDIVCIDAPVAVDLLLGASQMFYNGSYVHPELADVWDRLGAALRPPTADRTPTPKKIFVARGDEELRPCRNAAELEQMFGEHGFTILRPGDLTIPEQVGVFSDAEVIAGFGGSGMFSSIYSRHPGRRIVIASENYIARNEWTIAALKGDDYHHFIGRAEVREVTDPAQPHTKFQSGFSFDFDQDGANLLALVKD